MKALLVLVTLGLFSSVSFAADPAKSGTNITDIPYGERLGHMTGGEFCDGNGTKTTNVKGKKVVKPTAISN